MRLPYLSFMVIGAAVTAQQEPWADLVSVNPQGLREVLQTVAR